MVRAVDWSVVGFSGDPVPGDVGVVRDGGRRYVGVAERLGRCAAVLRGLEVGASQSESVAGLVEVKDGLVDEALRAEGRYRAAGAALEAYAVVLDRVQVESLGALRVAVGARVEVEAAEREGAYWQQRATEVAGLGAGVEVPAGAGGVSDPGMGAERAEELGRCQRLVERAQEERRVALGVIAAQREVIARAVADRDSAAREAIGRIERAGAADGLADKWWDD